MTEKLHQREVVACALAYGVAARRFEATTAPNGTPEWETAWDDHNATLMALEAAALAYADALPPEAAPPSVTRPSVTLPSAQVERWAAELRQPYIQPERLHGLAGEMQIMVEVAAGRGAAALLADPFPWVGGELTRPLQEVTEE